MSSQQPPSQSGDMSYENNFMPPPPMQAFPSHAQMREGENAVAGERMGDGERNSEGREGMREGMGQGMGERMGDMDSSMGAEMRGEIGREVGDIMTEENIRDGRREDLSMPHQDENMEGDEMGSPRPEQDN